MGWRNGPLWIVAALVVVSAVAAVLGDHEPGSRTHRRPHRPAFESRPGVPAAFLRQGYRPGDTAQLVLWREEPAFTVQFFRVGVTTGGSDRTTMQGTAVSRVYHVGATPAHLPVDLPIGSWRSGVYYAELRSGGLVGFAPFVVRPRSFGEHPVLVVEPTFTWQAYNFRDSDGDGRGDTWYGSSAVRTVQLDRPFVARGVPPHFITYDLPFLQWLERSGHEVDVVSDQDLDTPAAVRALGRYRLVVFPGHEEYVTDRIYDGVRRYRDGGGHLVFLSANNFFWRVVRRGAAITRTSRWRDLGRPEASVIGVQFIRNDRGVHQGPWRVTRPARLPWLFAGTGLRAGSPFGSGGIEIDHRAPGSPPGTVVAARIPNLMGPGYTAEMTYYSTPAGAEVFAAGAFTLAGARDAISRRVLANLWRHLTAG